MKPPFKNRFKTIGMMSGTSLDGLDLAAVEFMYSREKWKFTIHSAQTFSYSQSWLEKLKTAPNLPGEKLMELHAEYGRFIGKQINQFIKETGFKPDLVSSHGHTVFHQPEKQFTFQIGNGADIAAETGITTVCDFRTGDVALGGQGAPLVPVGDRLLFADYEYCLNLGGFSNISYEKENNRIAFDICPVNMILNYFAEKKGMSFDKDGILGRNGKINPNLLEALNSLEYYKQIPPKSLGREWVENVFLPVLNGAKISDADKLRTCYEHIAIQISKTLSGTGKILVTGGGAFNTFLMERIKKHSTLEIVIPTPELVNFKEALVFAFLGILKFRNEINCLSSVTGAKQDSSSGLVFPV